LSSLQKVEIGISLLAHKFSKSAKNWTFQSISRHNLVHSVISKLLKPFVSANHSLAARAAVGEVHAIVDTAWDARTGKTPKEAKGTPDQPGESTN